MILAPMQQAFPAFQLLLILSLTLIIGMPLMVWWFIRSHRDTGAKLWFLAVVANAMALVLVGLQQRFSAMAAVLFVVAVAFGIESMRWELGKPAANRRTWGVVLSCYAVLQWGLEAMGLRMSWGYILNLFLLNVGDAVLMGLLFLVSRKHHSRGLWMVALGIGLILVPNVVRLFLALLQGGGSEAFAGSASTNVAIVVITLVSVLHVVGYGGFVMEKLHQLQLKTQLAQARATERQQLAEQHAIDMEGVVRQRDEMIVLNSRFSAVNNLAMYNSAIVHEISQPLQALSSILDTMGLRAEQESSPLQTHVRNALSMVDKMSGTLASLRSLMAGQQPVIETVSVETLLDELLPVIQTQAQRQGVRLERGQATAGRSVSVRVNRVLLQRVIFNLATNALEAFAAQARASTPRQHNQEPDRLVLETDMCKDHGMEYLVLRVSDNGPGFPADLQLQTGLALKTTKDQGIGVGLTFAKMIVESWKGQLKAYNHATAHGGAVVEVWLPKVDTA